MPVIRPPPVMLLTVLFDMLDPGPPKSSLIPVIAPVGVLFAVQLSNVLLVIVFTGALEAEAPSWLTQP